MMLGSDPPSTLFVLDVESIGLRGEGFAAGFVVMHEDGRILTERLLSCSPDDAGSWDDGVDSRAWVRENCPALDPQFAKPRDLRTAFWRESAVWQSAGATMLADCPYPVEFYFIEQCIADNRERTRQAPYPLLDVASVLYAAGMDPVGTFERKPAELPKHDPLADARQSARLLLEALRALRERRLRFDALENLRAGALQILDGDRDPQVKLCNGCRWHDTGPVGLRCTNPFVNKRDPWALSRDAAQHAGSEAHSERAKLWPFGACGRRGALWAPPLVWARGAAS
jgi:hypothetical protein